MNYQKKQSIQVIGNDVMGFWTQRALSREGYQVSCEDIDGCKVVLEHDEMIWELSVNGTTKKCRSIEELLMALRSNHIHGNS